MPCLDSAHSPLILRQALNELADALASSQGLQNVTFGMAIWTDSPVTNMEAWSTVSDFLYRVAKPTERALEKLSLRISLRDSVPLPLLTDRSTDNAIQDILLSAKHSSLIFRPFREWRRKPFTREDRASLEETFHRLHEQKRLIIHNDKDLRD